MADLETFRVETRQWLTDNAPASIVGTASSELEGNWGGRKARYTNPDAKVWLDRMADKGWTAPEWPTRYGGGGLSKAEAKIVREEMAALKLPVPLIGFGLTMIGPTLLEYGTEEQKREHLPRIVRGEIRWCQGYSEPGSGSDLASLQTKAVLDGDFYTINGQKIWTSYANFADWMFMLVRTDPDAPKHRGITFMLMDMETPGVETRPIKLISGSSPFCETFLTDVRVPAKNVVSTCQRGLDRSQSAAQPRAVDDCHRLWWRGAASAAACATGPKNIWISTASGSPTRLCGSAWPALRWTIWPSS